MSADLTPIDILLVEDDAGDIVITREAFEHYRIGNTLHVVSDGLSALRFLRREPPYQDAPPVGLILLDLNLPRMDGREVLAVIGATRELRDIPVVVLTTSDAEEDIVRSYHLRASAYVAKPVDFDRLAEIVRRLDGLCFTVVRASVLT